MSSSEVPQGGGASSSSSSSSSSAAVSLLPAPTSLDTFLNASRAIRAAAQGTPPGPMPGGSAVAFGPGDLSEYVSRALEVLSRTPVANLGNALETLDVTQHSLGYSVLLAALLRHCGANLPDWDSVHTRVVLFIEDSDPEQVRLAPGATAEVCHHFSDELIRRGNPIVGLVPVRKALDKICPPPTPNPSADKKSSSSSFSSSHNFATLTSVHSDLCKLALASKCFSTVLPMLKDQDFTDVSREASSSGGGDSRHVLLFFYYGGMVLTAVKEYQRALYFFEVCVTIPAVAVSHVMLEAYKKYLLVSLIEGGHRPKELHATLPKYTSPMVTKYFKQLTAPYNELVSAFHNSRRPEELGAAAERHAAAFAADGNAGLVEQVRAARTRTDIRLHTNTFLTLSTAELATRVGLSSAEEAERMVVGMIEDGSINARISQKDGMVRFDARPAEQYDSERFLRRLEEAVQRCVSLDEELGALDEEITLNPAFIKRYHAASGAAGTGSGSSSSAAVTSGGPNSYSLSSMAAAADVDDAGPVAAAAAAAVQAAAAQAAATSAPSSSQAPRPMMNGGVAGGGGGGGGGASSTTGNGVPPSGMF